MRQFTFGLLALVLFFGGASGVSAQNSTTLQPDNTGVNAQYRDSNAVTADQQSNAQRDIDLTRKIRQAVMNDSSMSTLARNVKIVSANGKVTLLGPVSSEKEKNAIVHKADVIAGTDNVSNKLEVKSHD